MHQLDIIKKKNDVASCIKSTVTSQLATVGVQDLNQNKLSFKSFYFSLEYFQKF
jgi:hypothetical protein